jgi:hypothetical protein
MGPSFRFEPLRPTAFPIGVRVEWAWPTPDGSIAGVSTERVRFVTTWSAPTAP